MGHGEKAREQGAERVWEAGEQELLIIDQFPITQCSMPNTSTYLGFARHKSLSTSAQFPIPIPHSPFPIP